MAQLADGPFKAGRRATARQVECFNPSSSWQDLCKLHHEQPLLIMLSWTLLFLILALVAGVLGFTGLAGAAANIAQIMFFVFLVLLVISALSRAMRGRTP
jgi:uncharacterized membrane protein YtjA (UPF0391 family)